jgi:hypothetical protein
MATKTKKRSTAKRASAKRSTAKRSSAKRSKPKGIDRPLLQHGFGAKSKVEVYDAFGASPEGVPPGKPIRTFHVKANGDLTVKVPKTGRYIAVGEVETVIDGEKQSVPRRVEFRVN